jgi:ADP-ribose pyrophosphatase YjhB (NUDIX family)
MMEKKRHAGVIIKVGNTCLLCKRNENGKRPGEWSIPTGKIENGETPIDAAYREFYEETHIKLENKIDLVGLIDRRSRDGKSKKGVMYVFLSNYDKQVQPDLDNAKDGDEHTECGYYTIDNLPQPIGASLVELLKKVL